LGRIVRLTELGLLPALDRAAVRAGSELGLLLGVVPRHRDWVALEPDHPAARLPRLDVKLLGRERFAAELSGHACAAVHRSQPR
jgi:hypothetical protein